MSLGQDLDRALAEIGELRREVAELRAMVGCESPWLGVREVAAYLRMPEESVYKSPELRAIAHRFGKRLYWRREDLDELIASGRLAGRPPLRIVRNRNTGRESA